jgi:hypothetical protein
VHSHFPPESGKKSRTLIGERLAPPKVVVTKEKDGVPGGGSRPFGREPVPSGTSLGKKARDSTLNCPCYTPDQSP